MNPLRREGGLRCQTNGSNVCRILRARRGRASWATWAADAWYWTPWLCHREARERPPPRTKSGTCKTVKARFWPWLAVEGSQHPSAFRDSEPHSTNLNCWVDSSQRLASREGGVPPGRLGQPTRGTGPNRQAALARARHLKVEGGGCGGGRGPVAVPCRANSAHARQSRLDSGLGFGRGRASWATWAADAWYWTPWLCFTRSCSPQVMSEIFIYESVFAY